MPFLSKLLKQPKEICNNKFILFHTIKSKIRVKESGQVLRENEKDKGVGKWIYICCSSLIN